MPDFWTSLGWWLIIGCLIALYDGVESGYQEKRRGRTSPWRMLRPHIFLIQAVMWPITLLLMADIRAIRWRGRGLSVVDWLFPRQ